MKLSPNNAELESSLRARQINWARHRWYCLAAGVFCFTIGFWLILQVAHRAAAAEKWDGEIVCIAPMPWVLVIQGVVMCGFTLTRWHGNPLVILVMKLLDEVKNEAN